MFIVFGSSKSYADLIVQEYGKYWSSYSMFRTGCITGPNHSGPSFMVFSLPSKAALSKKKYYLLGYRANKLGTTYIVTIL